MHVVLGHVGQLEIDDVRQLVDVDAARGDVGCHQHLERAALEVGQRLGARGLALVAVDRHRGDALVVQILGEAVGAVLHAAEHQHLVPILALDQVGQQFLLLVAVDRMDLLRDGLDGAVAARHLDHLRAVQQAVGQGLDLVAEGRAEQQALLLLRHDRQHLLDVVDEAHVEHAVGFIEHEDLDVAQVQRALLVVVEQAAGRGHQDVDAALEAVDLRLHTDAAEHHHRAELGVLAVDAHAFLHLRRQFAGRREDQRPHRALAASVLDGRPGHQAVQHRQHEAGGLAGAGLGAGEQVAAQHDGRNGLFLDRRGRLVAGVDDGLQQGLGEPQFFE
ncbi:hypothetical protein X551_04306 [Methylibium sp. T29]|nr:hypothetical protein X551_04306 [Methylibium sp. T29]EWS57528.1 hypothetical protein Y694_04490 [Methylibium sp. T29-B]